MREAIETTLRVWYPGLHVTVETSGYGNRLHCSIQIADRRYSIITPPDLDYRSESQGYWLHRFSEAIKTKLK